MLRAGPMMTRWLSCTAADLALALEIINGILVEGC